MKKILLIEPSHDLAAYFRSDVVPAMPFQVHVTVASKTATAIDLLANNDFDIVISHVLPREIVNAPHIITRLRNGDFGRHNTGAMAIAYAPIGFDVTKTIDAGFDAQVDTGENLIPRLTELFRQYLRNSRARAFY